MDDEIRKMLDEEIKTEIQALSSLESTARKNQMQLIIW